MDKKAKAEAKRSRRILRKQGGEDGNSAATVDDELDTNDLETPVAELETPDATEEIKADLRLGEHDL